MSFSYDYEILIDELQSDVAEGLISLEEFVKIVRENISVNDYFPIIDYYYMDYKANEPYTEMRVSDVLKEMRYYNNIFNR